MAGRPFKEGLDYFELDCHLDDKIKLIQAEFGLKGFAVVVMLFQKIYGGHGYYCEWSPDRLLLFTAENTLGSGDKNLIEDIVSACLKRDIFSRDMFERYQILTSRGIQKRYLNAVSRRGTCELKKEYLLISDAKNSINVDNNSINVDNNSINVDINSQRKEKKRRVEKRKEDKDCGISTRNNCATYFPKDAELDDKFVQFVNYLGQEGRPPGEIRVETLKNQLIQLSMNLEGGIDVPKAVRILEQSMRRGWHGIFPLEKERGDGPDGRGAIDWDALMRQAQEKDERDRRQDEQG